MKSSLPPGQSLLMRVDFTDDSVWEVLKEGAENSHLTCVDDTPIRRSGVELSGQTLRVPPDFIRFPRRQPDYDRSGASRARIH